ncbi:Tat pathway signal protein [Streptomyces coeruleorubidus]|uniref:Tat pathway signal protein n=1 Tax=Streptomyces coeruleorubidus TaxID=116188 RepID=UPI0036BC740E
MGLRRTARGTTVAISLLAAAALAISASPASAKMSDGYVRGYDNFRGDWSDEGVFGFRYNDVSNAVCLWQTVLWANGATEENGTAFDRADIDGHFGVNTQYATKKQQVRWGLADNFGEADGRVGGNTFGEADDDLVKGGGFEDRGKTLFLTYNPGFGRTFDLYRNTSGIYWFKADGDSGPWTNTSYVGSSSCD